MSHSSPIEPCQLSLTHTHPPTFTNHIIECIHTCICNLKVKKNHIKTGADLPALKYTHILLTNHLKAKKRSMGQLGEGRGRGKGAGGLDVSGACTTCGGCMHGLSSGYVWMYQLQQALATACDHQTRVNMAGQVISGLLGKHRAH